MNIMKLHEFKEKYLKNAFFWVNQENHIEIQEIMMKCGFYPHTGHTPIKWHEGFKNLVTFPPDKNHNHWYYQKADMWIPNARYGEPVNIESFFADYKTIQ